MTILKHRWMRRSIGALLINALTLSGCTRWQAHTAPELALRGQQYDVVLVHPLEGRDIYVFDARITADSVQGVERTLVGAVPRTQSYVSKPVSIPLSAVRAVETPSTTLKPVLAVAGMVLVLLVIGVATADWSTM